MTKAPKPTGWSRVESRGSQVLLVYHEFKRVPWEQWYLLMSDEHWDNPKCRWDLLKKHHEQAKERVAGILKFGDTFCAMQGKDDKRASKESLRAEHRTDNYLGSLIETATDWYAPYAKNILLLGKGNHETSILDRCGLDLVSQMAGGLCARGGAPHVGGYSGWVRFFFKYHSQYSSQTLWYNHGYGGGGPVTKDMIPRNRQMVYVRNADLMVTGHTHDSWMDKTETISLSPTHQIVERGTVKYVKTGTYKDAYDKGAGGLEVEKGHPPKPLGGTWLRLFRETARSPVETELVWAE